VTGHSGQGLWKEVSITLAKRFLLCRPHGGLNDNLTLIARCVDYANKYDRIVIVDAKNSHFADDLSRVFLWTGSGGHRLRLSNRMASMLDQKTCFPNVLQGQVSSYGTRTIIRHDISTLEYREIVENESGASLSFDFTHDYEQQVLVCESYGGGVEGVDALRQMRLRRSWVRRIKFRLRNLFWPEYVGLHIRNTDLKSDYVKVFAEVAIQLNGRPIVVCSDDQAVLDMAHHYFDDSSVFTPSNVGYRNGKPFQIPYVEGRAMRDKVVLDTLVDLWALSGASEVFSAPIINRKDSVSGFSILAETLQAAPNVRRALVGRQFEFA
jgi:hypothetical protein